MPPQSDIAEVESQLLNELGGYIAANVADASISFVARNISTQSKADLQRDASDLPVLRLNLDFERAWATVNQALHEAKLDVTDVDRIGGCVLRDRHRSDAESGRQAVDLDALVPQRKQTQSHDSDGAAAAGLRPRPCSTTTVSAPTRTRRSRSSS